MVLNSLAAEKLEASLRLLAMHGRFLEIGKYDLSQNTGLGKLDAVLTAERSIIAKKISDFV